MTPLPSSAIATPFVHVDDLSIAYPSGLRAVENLSLDLAPNSFVSLVGPSGCGKSTFLKVLAGLLPATQGTLRVGDNRSASEPIGRGELHEPASNAAVAFVFQHPTLLAWRTVAQNVRLPTELRTAPNADTTTRLREVLDWVGLSDFYDAFPPELSGGMQMRVSIARALVTRPSLLLMDEPFAALDDITRQRLNEDLTRLWQRDQWNALFVTHNVAEAVYLSQRVLVMSPRPGRIIADIPIPLPFPRPRTLRTSPAFITLVAQVTQALSISEIENQQSAI